MFDWLKPKAAADPDWLGDEMREACATFIKRALRTGCADDGQYLHLKMGGCSIDGEPFGDWEFTCRRLRKPSPAAPSAPCAQSSPAEPSRDEGAVAGGE